MISTISGHRGDTRFSLIIISGLSTGETTSKIIIKTLCIIYRPCSLVKLKILEQVSITARGAELALISILK